MAKRNYTEEAYEQIKKTIEEIDNTDVSDVKDFFSDILKRIAQFLEIFTVDQYEEDMQKWYDIVLDSHNSTISEVYNIFEAVGKVDADYQKIMDGAVSSVTNFRSTLNCLRDVISGKTSLADGKAAADKYLAAGKDSLSTAYDTILTKMEKQVIVESGVAVIGDVLKLGGAFCSLLVPAGPLEYATKGKKFADSFVALLGDSGAFVSGVVVESIFGWGSLFGMDRKNYLDFRASQLMQNQEYKDMNSISDWLGGMAEDMEETLEDCPSTSPYYSVVKKSAEITHGVHMFSESVDIAADAYGILSDMKDIHDNVDSWMYGKDYTPEEYTKIFEKELPWKSTYYLDGNNGPMINVRTSPGEIISKLFSDGTGIPTSGWKDPSKYDGNVFKTLGTLWSYGEKLYSDPVTGQTNSEELLDVVFDKNKGIKFLKDVFDFARDVGDFAHSAPFNSTADGATIDTMGIGRIPLPDAAGSLPVGPRGGIGEMGGR